MSDPIDDQVWAGLERHIAAVESFVGEPASWRAEGSQVSNVTVRLATGGGLGRGARVGRGLRSRTAIAVILIVLAALVVGLLAAGLVGRQAPRQVLLPGFNTTGSMSQLRSNAAAVALPDGRALVIGGDLAVDGNPPASSTADLYEPTTGTFSSVGSLPAGVMLTTYSSATTLSDGRVLVVDGFHATAAIFDPRSATFAPVGSLSTPRSYAGAALLHDGRVLVVGGEASRPAGPALATAVLFDPATGVFTATGSMSVTRGGPTATTLPDGRVLVTSSNGAEMSCEIYDPDSGRFSRGGSMVRDREQYAVAPLTDGRVLFVGGWTASDAGADMLEGQAEIYDPTTGRFAAAGNLVVPRRLAKATTLLDGRVLITGGDQWPLTDTTAADLPSELFDPATMEFVEVPDSVVAMDAAVTRLRDGDVLIVDGSAMGQSVPTARLFHPARP